MAVITFQDLLNKWKGDANSADNTKVRDAIFECVIALEEVLSTETNHYELLKVVGNMRQADIERGGRHGTERAYSDCANDLEDLLEKRYVSVPSVLSPSGEPRMWKFKNVHGAVLVSGAYTLEFVQKSSEEITEVCLRSPPPESTTRRFYVKDTPEEVLAQSAALRAL